MAEWHYCGADRQQRGPVTSDELRELASSGQINRSTLIWREGLDQWIEAGQSKELFPGNSPPPLPPNASYPPPYPRSQTLAGQAEEPERMTAILLAFFLGLLGAQWFYLKNRNRAILYLVGGTVGWILLLPPIVVGVFSLIDAVTWLGWSDQRFKSEFMEQYNAL